MALPHSALVRPQQPALQQGGHAMNAREVAVEPLRVSPGHRCAVPVAQCVQLGIRILAKII